MMKAVVFDLDGTLVDSAADLQAAANRLMRQNGLEELDRATVTTFIGNGIARLVERAAAEQDWVDLPAGPSPTGDRDWQWWARRVPDPDSEVGGGAWARWVIARRRPEEPAERDYYLAWGPPETSVEALAAVAGARWRVEEAIKLAKSACGMADYEVRSWHGWYRHITLAQLAAAFLAVQDARAARDTDPPPARGGERGAADRDDRPRHPRTVQRL